MTDQNNQAAGAAGEIVGQLAKAVAGRMMGDIPEEDKAGILQDYTEEIGTFNFLVGHLVNTMERFAVYEEDYRCRSLVDYIKLWNRAVRDEASERDKAIADAEAAQGQEDAEAAVDDGPHEPEDGEESAGEVIEADFRVEK